LKLVAQGKINRYKEGRAVLEIQRYEFRTQGNSSASLRR
jgi:hypothetical protein